MTARHSPLFTLRSGQLGLGIYTTRRDSANELPEFRWINTVLSNLKTSFSGTFHALKFDKYADRYLGAFNYRFNRRFNLGEMTERVVHSMCSCSARPEHLLRSAEFAT